MMPSGDAAPPLARTPRDPRALVAIDLGAESCRVSLLQWTASGPSVRLVHRFPNAAITTERGLRWPMESILAELWNGLRLCAELAPEGIRSVGVDGWAVDYVRLNDAGHASEDPFCYRDERTLDAEPRAHAAISADRMRALTGVQLSRINTVYQLVADAEHLAGSPWLNLPEYVLHRLGGRRVAELTNASHSQLVTTEGTWSEEIFARLNLRSSHAPAIVPPGTDLGQLSGELAELPQFASTRLIAPACHDTASAIAAIPDPGESWAYISSGTWSLVGTLLESPMNSPEARAANFTNLGAADGKICFHSNVNGLWLLRQCMEAWRGAGAELTIPDLIRAAEAVPPPAYTLDVDDPDLLLPGDMPARINAQLRRRELPELSPHATDAPAMASFLFHSLAARYAQVLETIEHLTRRRFTHLYIVGGGSQNTLLNRLTSEATGLLIAGTETEGSTLGNFAVQLAALDREAVSPSQGEPVPTWAWAKLLQTATRS